MKQLNKGSGSGFAETAAYLASCNTWLCACYVGNVDFFSMYAALRASSGRWSAVSLHLIQAMLLLQSSSYSQLTLFYIKLTRQICAQLGTSDNLESKFRALEVLLTNDIVLLKVDSLSCAQLGTSDNLESKFRALEGGDVEDELAQLKRGTLTGARAGSPQQLPEGRPIRYRGIATNKPLFSTIVHPRIVSGCCSRGAR